MQWIIDHAWWLAGYVVIAVLAAERKRMWDDLRPKQLRYTWKGVYFTLMSAVTVILLARIFLLLTDSQPIVRGLTIAFLSLLGGLAAVTIVSLYLCGKLDKRVSAIEKHLASPATPSPTDS